MSASLQLLLFVVLFVAYVHSLRFYGLRSAQHTALRPLRTSRIETTLNRLTAPTDSSISLPALLPNQPLFAPHRGPSEPLAVAYLEQELGLSDAVLKRIILKHPWVLYLKVNSNLRPTLDVFYSFDFKKRDIQKVVSRTPSVLAINHEWTLPEKLLSLQKMFYLTRSSLAKLVAAQPYLLTSSIARNEKTADFLRSTVQLTEKQVAQLLTKEPNTAMMSVDVLRRCWGLLVKLYGFTPEQTRAMILRYPALLSIQLVRNAKERLILLSSELGVPSFPSAYIQALAMRFPPLLYIDTETFLTGNVETLQSLLAGKYSADSSDSTADTINMVNDTDGVERGVLHTQLTSLLKVFPQLLGYNNRYLRGMCHRALSLLTGQPPAPTGGDNDVPVDAVSSDWAGLVVEMSQDGSILELDLLSEVVDDFDQEFLVSRASVVDAKSALKSAQRRLQVSSQLALEVSHLTIDGAKAIQVLRAAPWILSYRTQRSQTVLAALAVSLGMTREELSRCVSIYPRLLSLSVDGKLESVLVHTAEFAAAYCGSHRGADELHAVSEEASSRGVPPAPEDDVFFAPRELERHRCNAVRRLVRDLVLRYPLLLGTGLERIEERFACAAASGAAWDAYLTILRRSPAKHEAWLARNALSASPPHSTVVVGMRVRQRTTAVSLEDTVLHSEETAVEVLRSTKRKAAKKRKQVKRDVSPAERKRAANLRQVLLWRRQVKQDSIVFPEFPEAVHMKAIFRNEKRQMSDSTRRALNDLLPYRFLSLE